MESRAKIIEINSNLAIIEKNDKIFSSKIKGNLKYLKNKPLVGDFVDIQEINNEMIITKIYERKNKIIRPSISNIDSVLIVQSVIEPDLNLNLLMKYLAYYEYFIEDVAIIFTKCDLLNEKQSIEFINILNILKNDGYIVYCLPNENEFQKLKKYLSNKIFCLAGNSGVGKSTLVNKLFPNLNIKTQAISQFLNRGKHTTTTTRIYKDKNFSIVDTPGFSTIDINLLTKLQLAHSFHDFKELSLKCKFNNCLHKNENSCAIKEAVQNNKISILRYEYYLKLLNEINNNNNLKYK